MRFNRCMGDSKTRNIVQTFLLAAAYVAVGLALRSGTVLDWGVSPAAAEGIHAALWAAVAVYATRARNTELLIVLTALLAIAQSYYALHGATYGYLTASLPLALLTAAWVRPHQHRPTYSAALRVVCAAALLVMGIRISLNTMIDAGPSALWHAAVLVVTAVILAVGEARFHASQHTDTAARSQRFSRICVGVVVPVLMVATAIASLAFA